MFKKFIKEQIHFILFSHKELIARQFIAFSCKSNKLIIIQRKYRSIRYNYFTYHKWHKLETNFIINRMASIVQNYQIIISKVQKGKMGCLQSYPIKKQRGNNVARSKRNIQSSKQSLRMSIDKNLKHSQMRQNNFSFIQRDQNAAYETEKIQQANYRNQAPTVKVYGPQGKSVSQIRKSRKALLQNMEIKDQRFNQIRVLNVRY